MAAVRADNWSYANGDLNSELGTSIKRQIRARISDGRKCLATT